MIALRLCVCVLDSSNFCFKIVIVVIIIIVGYLVASCDFATIFSNRLSIGLTILRGGLIFRSSHHNHDLNGAYDRYQHDATHHHSIYLQVKEYQIDNELVDHADKRKWLERRCRQISQ